MSPEEQLRTYITQQLQAGISEEQISQALIETGWQASQVASTMEELKTPATVPASVQPTVTSQTSEQPIQVQESVQAPVETPAQPSIPEQKPEPVQMQAPAQEEAHIIDEQIIGPAQTPLETQTSVATPAQPVMQPMQTMQMGSTQASSNGTKWLWAAIGAVMLLLLVGGGAAYAYFTYFNAPSPETLLTEAAQNMLAATSFTLTGTTTASIDVQATTATSGVPVGTSASVDAQITSQGSIDKSSSAIPHIDVIGSGQFNAKMSTTSSGSLYVSEHMISDGQNMYFKLRDFKVDFSSTDPRLAMAQIMVGAINAGADIVKGKWIVATSTSSVPTTAVPTISMATSSPAVQADLKALMAYLSSTSYVTSIKNVGSENVRGVSTYHIQATAVLGQPFVDFIQKLWTDAQPTVTKDPGFADDMRSIKAFAFKTITIDFWVGKKDQNLYKASIVPLASPIYSSVASTTVSVSSTISYSGFNQPVVITAPSGAKTPQEIFTSLASSSPFMMGGLSQTTTSTTH